MAKIGFKPVWTEKHCERAREFEASYTGLEQAVDIDECIRRLYGDKPVPSAAP